MDTDGRAACLPIRVNPCLSVAYESFSGDGWQADQARESREWTRIIRAFSIKLIPRGPVAGLAEAGPGSATPATR